MTTYVVNEKTYFCPPMLMFFEVEFKFYNQFGLDWCLGRSRCQGPGGSRGEGVPGTLAAKNLVTLPL